MRAITVSEYGAGPAVTELPRPRPELRMKIKLVSDRPRPIPFLRLHNSKHGTACTNGPHERPASEQRRANMPSDDLAPAFAKANLIAPLADAGSVVSGAGLVTATEPEWPGSIVAGISRTGCDEWLSHTGAVRLAAGRRWTA